MKYNKNIGIVVFLFLFFFSFVAAQETFSVETLRDAGVTPQSPFYRIDLALEKILFLMNINPQNKIAFGFQLAQERILEIEEMLEAGKLEEAQEADEEHGKIFADLALAIENFEDDDSVRELEIELGMEMELEGEQE